MYAVFCAAQLGCFLLPSSVACLQGSVVPDRAFLLSACLGRGIQPLNPASHSLVMQRLFSPSSATFATPLIEGLRVSAGVWLCAQVGYVARCVCPVLVCM